MSRKKTAINIIGNIVFYTLLIAFIFISAIMVGSVKDGKQASILGHKFFVVLTGSMSPTIEVGDLVITKDISPEKIQVNDVITFGSKNSDNITTHRVKDIINEEGKIKFVTQGDANNVQDPSPVDEEVLVGKVIKFIPKMGIAMSWLKDNLKVILVFTSAIIFLLVIAVWLKNRLKTIDNDISLKQ